MSDYTEQILILSSRQLEPEVCLSVTQFLPFLDGLKLSSSPSCAFRKQSKKRTAHPVKKKSCRDSIPRMAKANEGTQTLPTFVLCLPESGLGAAGFPCQSGLNALVASADVSLAVCSHVSEVNKH